MLLRIPKKNLVNTNAVVFKLGATQKKSSMEKFQRAHSVSC